ncbi:MAG: tetratricopeptide repeat-containing protein kinase family protein, partial [Steroidobacteraceae bacterium]
FLALTPEYASPEQVRGETITTASDVYSLGVLLYRLLAGALPHTANGTSTWQLATEICERDAALPSVTATRTGAAYTEFAKRLRGDLDNVILKALKKDPAERYASAEQFAEDLRRYLRGFPVAARADTTTYRMRKFVRRNRSAALGALLFVIALAGGVVATSWQAHVASLQRQRAERHFNEVRELSSTYLADVYDAIAKLPGGTTARKLLVENSMKYLGSLEREAQDSPELQRDLALAYERLGDVQGDWIGANLGDTQGAVDNYRRSLQMRRAIVARHPSNEARRDLVRSCVMLSEMLIGQSIVPEALALSREAVAAGDELLENPRASAEDRRYAATAHMTLGWEQGLLGDIERGMPSMTKAQVLFEQIAAENPRDVTARRSLMLIAARIGDVYLDNVEPQPTKSLPFYEQALQVVQSLLSEQPENAEFQRAKAFVLTTMGEAQNSLGHAREALAHHERALEIIERFRAVDEADRLAQVATAFVLNGRGKSHLLLGEHEAALSDLNRAEEILRKAPPQPTEVAEIRLLPGLTYANLALVTAALAQREPTRASLRVEHSRQAHEWSQRAFAALQPLSSDVLEGPRAKRLMADVQRALRPLDAGAGSSVPTSHGRSEAGRSHEPPRQARTGEST